MSFIIQQKKKFKKLITYPLSLIPYPQKNKEKEKNTSSQTIPYTFGLNDTFFSKCAKCSHNKTIFLFFAFRTDVFIKFPFY